VPVITLERLPLPEAEVFAPSLITMSRHQPKHTSASMHAVHADALGSANGYVETAKRYYRALYEARFLLITFSSESVDTIRKEEMVRRHAGPMAGQSGSPMPQRRTGVRPFIASL
jgi:hypothetical protein